MQKYMGAVCVVVGWGVLFMASAQEDAIQKMDAILAKADSGVPPLDALAEIDTLLVAYPDFALGHAMRALMLVGLSREDEALAAFDVALRLDPKQIDALYYSGLLLSELGRVEEAAARFDRAADADPTTPSNHIYNAAQAYYDAKRYADALERWRRFLVLVPGDFRTTEKIIQCHFALGQYDDAQKVRESLYHLRKTSTDMRIQYKRDYIFDQFTVGGGLVYAKEVFDPENHQQVVYTFEYIEDNKVVRAVILEAGEKAKAKGAQLVVVLEEGEARTVTGATFTEAPDYPVLKAQVIDLFTKRAAGQAIE
jgi:tetratricopeptide (TPR) repeat protein